MRDAPGARPGPAAPLAAPNAHCPAASRNSNAGARVRQFGGFFWERTESIRSWARALLLDLVLTQRIPEAKPPREVTCVVWRDEGGLVPGFRDEGAKVN